MRHVLCRPIPPLTPWDRLQEVFRSLGCKLDKPSAAETQVLVEEAKRNGRDASDALKDRIARLVVPLTFPVPKRGKRK